MMVWKKLQWLFRFTGRPVINQWQIFWDQIVLIWSKWVQTSSLSRKSTHRPLVMPYGAIAGAILGCPDSKIHGANMGAIWGRQDPGGPHVGPMNFVIWLVVWQCQPIVSTNEVHWQSQEGTFTGKTDHFSKVFANYTTKMSATTLSKCQPQLTVWDKLSLK